MAFWDKTERTLPTIVKGISGFFGEKRNLNAENMQRRILAAEAKSIHVGMDSLKAVNEEGYAMDSSLQQAKIINSRQGILPIQQLEFYGSQGFIGWQTCTILSQNWLIDKACTMPAKDAIRHGYEIEFNGNEDIDPKIIDEFRKQDKEFQIKRNCLEFIRMGRVFGIRHAMFIVESPDPDYYAKPFNPDGIRAGSYKGITQVDPYWLAPELDYAAAANPASKYFYEPTWWRVNGKRVHRTHMVIFRNGDQVPDILKPSYFYGGIPTPQKIAERVYAAERTANEAPLLAMSKRLFSLKVDTSKAMADFATFKIAIEEWTALMNNFGVKIIGGDEEVQQFDTSLTGLDETIMTQYQLVAAAANVPATKLLGTTPKGFNATGEYEEASYHEELESIQENDLSALVERHHLILMRSHIAPKFGISPVNTEVKWNPVDSPTAEEAAEINAKKSASDAAWVNMGAVDGLDVRQRLIKDRDSGYTGISDMVPGGPGDREHEQEMQEQMLEKPDEDSDGK